MSESTWAVLAGMVSVIVLRLLDWWLPRGRMSKWAAKHSVPDDTVMAEDEQG